MKALRQKLLDGATAAELTLSGGLGYRPVSFSGLVRHDGWKLERRTDGDWERVDQSSSVGNDWWQATHDPAAGTWTVEPAAGPSSPRTRCSPRLAAAPWQTLARRPLPPGAAAGRGGGTAGAGRGRRRGG